MTMTVDDISRLAKALVDADEEVDKREQALKDAKESARVLREETIPSAMQELELTEVVLSTGQSLKVQQEVYASIPANNKMAAYEWLDDNGFGGLIKIEVDAQFGKGEQEAAKALLEELRNRGLQVTADQSVHASTLKAFLKEQITKGNPVPLDLFGARPVWVAKISKK